MGVKIDVVILFVKTSKLYRQWSVHEFYNVKDLSLPSSSWDKLWLNSFILRNLFAPLGSWQLWLYEL